MNFYSKLPNTNTENDEDGINSTIIHSPNVTIELGPSSHNSGSSAVATRNITNYPWENQCFPGNIVAVHCSKDFIVSAIKGKI